MNDLEVPLPNFLNAISDPTSFLPYLLIALFVLLSAFFAGTETALSYCNRHRIKVYADDGKTSAKLVLKILDKFDNAIIAMLIGTNIAHIALSTIATVILIFLLNDQMGTLVATISSTLVVFFLGDMIPKNIAQVNSDRWAMSFSYIIYFFIIILYPLIFIFSMFIKLIRFLFLRKKENEDSFTEDDFQDVVSKVEEEGILDEEESDIIQNAVDFGDIKVKDIYTKKEDIVAMDIKYCTNNYVKEFITNHPFSRIPIYDGQIDNIIGVLHVRTYLKSLFKNKDTKVNDVMMKPYFISPSLKLDEIIEGYRKHHTHIAFIKNKNGLIGLVTLKEVLEELVGEIDEKNTIDTEVNDDDNE